MKTRIIEIEEQKFEISESALKRVDKLKIGDNVKVLLKPQYEKGSHEVFPGVIAGYENFKSLPTIVIAYLDISYGEAALKFLYFNSSNKDAEIVRAGNTYIPVEKSTVLQKMDTEIARKEDELSDLLAKKEYFLNNFNRYFEEENDLTS